MGCCASVVQGRKDSRRSALFNEITHNFVVEVFDRCPLNLFADIFFLLRLQCELDENLLELLVDVVNAKLLKRVVLENLESEDILCWVSILLRLRRDKIYQNSNYLRMS